MAKQQRGSNRASSRPTGPASPAPSNRPSGQRPAGQRPAGQKSGGTWQPNRVSTGSKSSSGPNRTAIMTVAAVIVGVLIVAYVGYTQLTGPGGGGTIASNAPLITPGSANSTPSSIPTNGRTLGNPNAPVTIDIWGDFRCSACYQFTEMGTTQQIDTQLVATGQAKVVWHDYLIIDHNDQARGVNTNASRDAANAAWCGADQNKFWVMHDWLFANQSPSEDPSAFTIDRLTSIAQAAGLDMTKFTPCLQNGTHNQDIATEEAGKPAAIQGTPTVFVNNTMVDATFPAIKAAVQAAAGTSGSPAASGSAPASSAAASPAPSGS